MTENKTKVLKKVKITISENTNSALIVSLNKVSEQQYSVSFSSKPDKIVEDILRTTMEIDGKTEEEKWDLFLQSMGKNGVLIEQLPLYDISISTILDNEKMISSIDASTLENNGLARKLVPDIQKAIEGVLKAREEKLFVEVQNSINNKLSDQEIGEKILACAKFFLGVNRGKIKELFTYALMLNYEEIERNLKKELIEIVLCLGEQLVEYAPLYELLDLYQKEYSHEISDELLNQILLGQANGAAQKRRKEHAYILYRELLEKTVDWGTKAWVHTGMASLLKEEDPEYYHRLQLSAEAFLQAGNQEYYIGTLIKIATKKMNNNPAEAVTLIDEAMLLYDSKSVFDSEKISSLKILKAKILLRIGKQADALIEAEESLDLKLKADLFGNETSVIAAINMVKLLGGQEQEYQENIDELENRIQSGKEKCNYVLRKDLGDALVNGTMLELYEERVNEQEDIELKALFNIMKATREGVPLLKKIEYLDNAGQILGENSEHSEIRSVLYSIFAYVYKKNNNVPKALEWYQKSLNYNFFNYSDRQSYISLLWDNNLWQESYYFFEKMKKIYGDTSSILYGCGKSLLGMGEPEKAIPCLANACSLDPENEYIKELLQKAAIRCSPTKKVEILPISNDKEGMTLSVLKTCINEFGDFIEAQKRMSFWQFSKDDKHKWISCPEAHAQNLLHTFLSARLGQDVEVFEEVSSGAGKADVYVVFNDGLRSIIELKMCGKPYSENYAKEGFEQLIHYMNNKKVKVGFLIVFDGRIRDYGRNFQPVYKEETNTIFCKNYDVRPRIKKEII